MSSFIGCIPLANPAEQEAVQVVPSTTGYNNATCGATHTQAMQEREGTMEEFAYLYPWSQTLLP
jgi:hypothetical protein